MCCVADADEAWAVEKNKAIEDESKKEIAQNMEIKKLLLLGSGESGKSTLFKQMIKLYGEGYSREERMKFKHIVYCNTVTAMQTLIRNSERLGHLYPELDTLIQHENGQHAQSIIDLKVDAIITGQIGARIQSLWHDRGIRNTYAHRSKFQLADNSNWFFDHIEQISSPDYCPSEQDILRSRVRTTGIVETEFEIEGNRFRMFDVGGQRNERKKWIHCFENVTAVIFVVAMSSYDQVLYEDNATNRIHEALNLFADICNSQWFRNTPMILFLNKKDLFEEKIQCVPLDVCFPEYFGEQTFDACSAFMQEQFEIRNRNPKKPIYTHITCATDSNNVHHVFSAVKDIVIRRSLSEVGLM